MTDQAARIIFLDNLLADYESDAAMLRAQMHKALESVRDTLWPKKDSKMDMLQKIESSQEVELLVIGIRMLMPQNDEQRIIKNEAMQIS
ncbi:MAG: hypothetical protein ABI443_06770 [Chthoniobacterales bacterium]